MASIFSNKNSLFISVINYHVDLFVRAQLFINVQSRVYGRWKKMWTEKYRRGSVRGTWGEMEQYHRQLLIPVAIEPNSMVPLVLVKENNVNNNESSDNVSDDRVVVECNSRIAQTPGRKTTARRSVHRWRRVGKKREINSR